jgi:hypothetical protein
MNIEVSKGILNFSKLFLQTDNLEKYVEWFLEVLNIFDNSNLPHFYWMNLPILDLTTSEFQKKFYWDHVYKSICSGKQSQ